jgi:Flp pilus assembly protein TadG
MRRPSANRRRQRGVGLVEFSIAGIAMISLMISTVQIGLAMWNYHTLAYAVHETNRYVSTHGRSCTTGGNNCTIYVGDIANKLKSYAVGIPDTNMSMTLTTNNASYTCSTVSSCESDTTQWPPTAHGDNYPNTGTSQITASITMKSMIVALWYGWSGQTINSVTLKTTSKVLILF